VDRVGFVKVWVLNLRLEFCVGEVVPKAHKSHDDYISC